MSTAEQLNTDLDPEIAQAAIEFCYSNGWDDGLPVVPVSQNLLDQFLATTTKKPDETIGFLPQVNRTVTVEIAAINAALAGCKPEYFPVVLAAWEALNNERATTGGGWQSTSGPAPLIIVNGPIRNELGFNSTGGVFGPGFRANATVARAIGFIVRNAYGIRPHELEQATQGLPGRWSICIGENEEESPWPPLAQDLGVEGSAVTTTLLRTMEYVDNRHSSNVVHLLEDFADTIGRSGAWIFKHAQVALILCPEHATRLAEAGYSRRDVAEWLIEHSGRTSSQLARAGKDDGSKGVRFPGDGLNSDEFQNVLPPLDPSQIIIAVSGSQTAGISMVARLFADWSGKAVQIDSKS